MEVRAARPSPWRNLSFVWLVPLLALVVSLGVAWRTFSERGIEIQIVFANGSGVTAGETTIRFRDVVVGTVEQVGFTADLASVLVTARIDKAVAPYVDDEAEFWVVRPEVSAQGISGLSTVLSGVYIQGAWDETPGGARYRFLGLDGPSLAQPGREGRRITLRSTNGKLVNEGAPVLFQGIVVGRLERPRLTLSSDAVVVDAFIEAPHDRRLTDAVRFWDTSGFSVSLGAGGFEVDVDSLASLVTGGVEFGVLYEGGQPVGPGYVYDIFPEEADARRSLYARSAANAVTLSVPFDEPISGLSPGATVTLRGVEVGEVSAISAQADPTDSADIRLVANVSIDPSLLGLPREAGREEVLDFFEEAVRDGLRAQLSTTSLFSAALIVDLKRVDDAPPAEFDRNAEPFPILPSTPSNLPDFTATAEGLFERINSLPIEELLQQAIATLASVEDLARDDNTKAVPASAAALLEDIRGVVNDEATQALPGELRAAVADLRSVVEELRENGALANLASAIERANAALDNIATASEDMPELVEDLRAVAAKVNGLKTDELVAAATGVLESADQILDTDGARALPPTLTSALDEIRATLAELRAGGAVENANATMASAREAADSVAEAVESLPELSERLQRLVTQAESLIAAYGSRSDFNAETLDALREVRNAARAVAALARAIERDPNSLLFGR